MINPHTSPRHIALILAASLLSLTDPLTAQDNEVAFQRNLADEAIAENFSAERAIDFIEDLFTEGNTIPIFHPCRSRSMSPPKNRSVLSGSRQAPKARRHIAPSLGWGISSKEKDRTPKE